MPVPDDRIRRISLDDQGRVKEISKAYLILKYAHDSASALLQALRTVRERRNAARGALTDEEQDLLRAMLVMSASGLDSMTKQLLHNSFAYSGENDR
jgi:hypothetical protein